MTTEKEELPVVYRQASVQDLNFILNSWLKSYRYTPAAEQIPSELYFEHQKNIINKLLETSKVIMITNPDDTSHVYGYIVYLNDVLHYIYIKYTYRNFGLTEKILSKAFPHFKSNPIYLTHLDKIFDRKSKTTDNKTYKSSFFLKKKDEYKFVYNPYLIKP